LEIVIGVKGLLTVGRVFVQTGIPKAQYGGRHTVTMLPGSGIGPELMNYVKEVFRYKTENENC
jgi:hypothetical protein